MSLFEAEAEHRPSANAFSDLGTVHMRRLSHAIHDKAHRTKVRMIRDQARAAMDEALKIDPGPWLP